MAEGIQSPELPRQRKPEFDGGSFTIEYLSTSPNGFEVVTDKSGRRRNQITPTTRVPIPLDPDQREQLKRSMTGQIRFAEGDKAKTSLDKLRSAKIDQERTSAIEDYQNKRETYKERAMPTIGLRNIRHNDNIITVDIKPVDFPTYREFSKSEAPNELLDFASASSTSMILITKDNRLILQHRSTRNKLYGGVPGASVAGYLRGNFDSTEKGKFVSIGTDFVKNDSAREANEELGLDREDFMALSIVGITHERVRVHDEFMLLGQTNLTAEEMKEKAMKTSRNRRLSEQEFDEKFVDIPADPTSITALLTKVKCPIPPTHIAAFVSAGYYMMLEQFGMQKAMEWKNILQDTVKKNYLEIDQMVEKYYLKNPNVLNEIPERHKNSNLRKRNQKGYDPEFLPEEQGLPDLVSELKRVKLITDSNEISEDNETRKTVDHMLIMDVDGVITNPQEKRITEPEILDQIAKRLEKGEPVALNTGRSVEWMRDRILNPLAQIVKDKKMLRNFLAVGEKGGTWAEFDEEGNIIESKDNNISVPDYLKNEVRNLIKNDYSGSMFYDESKLTMISTEMKDGHPLEDYREKQKILVNQLRTLLSDKGLEDKFKVDPTTIAIDVENNHVGKHFAVKRIIEWVKNKGIAPKRYIAFGDSFRSDIPMAEEIHSQGFPVDFVYVGEENVQTADYPFPINQPIAHFGNGTLEYLKSL